MGSFLVLDENDDGYRGLDIPMSGKSMLLAWIRTAAVVATIFTGIGAFFAFIDPMVNGSGKFTAVALFVAAIAFVYFTMFHKLTRTAGYTRAMDLASQMGPEAEALVEHYFDVITEQELQGRLESGAHDGRLNEYGGEFEAD